VSLNRNQRAVEGNIKERDMSTTAQMATPTPVIGANRIVAGDPLSQLRNTAPLSSVSSATVNDGLRLRHVIAARRAEATRLAERARWSQHNADASWYAGKLRAARQFDDQAARERELAAWLTAEADALVPA
jgi:hypothetical protein